MQLPGGKRGDERKYSQMRGKLWKWLVVCILASLGAGVISYYYVRPYLPEKLTLDFVKGGQTVPAAGSQTPQSRWQDRKRKRALAVSIDNIAAAGPQYGLEQAEVVVEVPVEGGLTRLLAIITGDDIERVGPIRSARPYLVDLAKEYNAVLVHSGGSPDALTALDREKLDNIDEVDGGPSAEKAFWRVTDRPKPHNLFASSDSLRRAAQELKYNLTTPPQERKYLSPGTEADGEPSADITIYYPNRESVVRYTYNKDTKAYARFKAGQPHNNAKGEQFTAANVIIQYVPFLYSDGDGRLQLILHGDGEAVVMREGKMVKASWQKLPGGFTKFIDAKGKEILLSPGPTWIEVVKKGTRVDY